MIPDALVSTSFLLFGSGCCIYRLIKYSDVTFTEILPQYVIASVGIAAVGGRSLHALVYNLFWRSYPIDPTLIAKELQKTRDDKNIFNWILRKIGVSSLVYSFYHHYDFTITGTLIIIAVTACEVLYLREETNSTDEIHHELERPARGTLRRFSSIVNSLPCSVATFWILSAEFIGWMTGNHYCRLANIPFAITVWAFPQQGFYKGWSIMDCINDYMMLCYIILMSEGLCQQQIVN